jgi:hypothetical protein
MLSHPSSISLSTRTLNHLADLIRARRLELRSRWRRLAAGRQALLALAHLRNGDTPARLAAGFEIGSTTAWRYIREAVDLLAATAPTLAEAMASIARIAHTILDGTLIRIDRLGGTRKPALLRGQAPPPRRQRPGDRRLRRPVEWVSPALPGSTHDLTAAREHGIIDALTDKDVMTSADKGYQGAGGTVRTPHKRHHRRPALSRNQNRCPQRATQLLAAIFVLQLVEEQRQPG